MRAALASALTYLWGIWQTKFESHHKFMLTGAIVFLVSIWMGSLLIALCKDSFSTAAWLTTIMGAIVGVYFFFRGANEVDF